MLYVVGLAVSVVNVRKMHLLGHRMERFGLDISHWKLHCIKFGTRNWCLLVLNICKIIRLGNLHFYSWTFLNLGWSLVPLFEASTSC